MNTGNFNCGLSDVHNIISVQIKGNVPSVKREYNNYRSFKNFDNEAFIQDLEKVNFEDITNTEHDVNNMYINFEKEFIAVVDKHAPIKKRKPCQKPAPFINKELRSVIYKKRQLHNKYKKYKSKQNWENYRLQRNLVTKIKKKSIKTYFYERCIGGPKSKDFWPTIKPFITNKGSQFSKDVILKENENIINNQNEVAEKFNNFFINVAKDIGNGAKAEQNHPSINKIYENKISSVELEFQEITEEFIHKQINKINIKKATGKDGISAKMLKLAEPVIANLFQT